MPDEDGYELLKKVRNASFKFSVSLSLALSACVHEQPIIAKKVVQEFAVPNFEEIPKGPIGDSIRRGKEYAENTRRMLPKFVGAKMNCTNCHLASGTVPNAGPWVGVTARFPQYRSRSAKVDALQDRVNDCFERSLNGKRMPEKSREMTDIVNYMTWLSRGYATGQDVKGSGMPKLELSRAPDLERGKEIFRARCIACHQMDGRGIQAEGKVMFPPLWGKDSFNVGAGMARLHTAAGFIKHNMPPGNVGSLSDGEAWDVAAYVSQQPRPDFKRKHLDWAKGDKPKDARY